MHSRMDILLEGFDEDASTELAGRIYDEVKRLDARLNRFDPKSDVYCINNRNALGGYEADTEMTDIFASALKYRDLTFGAFDICIQTSDFMPMTDYYRVNPDNGKLIINRDDAVFDFGGFAKGYALERIKDMVASAGIKNALLSFGNSSVYGLGLHPLGKKWPIGIENPEHKSLSLGTVELNDSALSISGNTSKHTAHIKSPETGVWNVEKKIISVQADSALDCEVLSTALFAVGSAQEKEMIKSNFAIGDVMEFDLPISDI